MSPWMRTRVCGYVREDGSIEASVTAIEPGEGKKPGSLEAVGDANPAAFNVIRDRAPCIPFETWCSIGGATAIMAPYSSLLTFPGDGNDRLAESFESRWAEMVLLETVRNTFAPGGRLLRHVCEPTGGGAESNDLELWKRLETVEMGVYKPTGWGEFHGNWPIEHETAVHAEQKRCWKVADPKLRHTFNVMLHPMDVGVDTFNGQRGLFCCGPVGDITFLTVVGLDPLGETDLMLRDLEMGRDSVLDRKIVAIARMLTEGMPPAILEMDHWGGLDQCGLHSCIGGWNVRLLSHLAKALLGPYGLNWMSKEELGVA